MSPKKPLKIPPEDTFLADMDALAADLLRAAKSPAETLENKLEIFKYCAQYYVNTQKVKKKAPALGNGPTMADLRSRVGGQQGDPE